MPESPHRRDIETRRLRLVGRALEQVRAAIDGMQPQAKAQLSADWLAQLDDPNVGVWTLGFAIVHQDVEIGTCGFKGPPDGDGIVEIAYGLSPDYQGRGYATEAAEALVGFAFGDERVRIVRAHTLS